MFTPPELYRIDGPQKDAIFEAVSIHVPPEPSFLVSICQISGGLSLPRSKKEGIPDHTVDGSEIRLR